MLKKILISPVEKEQGDILSYMKLLENGAFTDVFNYGIAEEKRGYLLVNPFTDPGALYCGGMGSGKSIAMKFTLITHLLSNSRNTMYILYDGLKGMADYKIMFGLKDNVAYAINDPAKIVPVIDMIHGEMMARKEEFAKYNANGILEYDEIMERRSPGYKGLSRIVLAIEEFHQVPNSEYVKFHSTVDNPGSVAFQIKELMRVGRSYGLTLIAATQRAVADDFPSTLKVGISQMMAFRVSNINDVSALNLAHAGDIKTGNPGRCAYSGGFIQFPYLTDDVADWLLKKYYKPLEAKTLKYSIQDFQKAFSGEGNSGMILVKPYRDILVNHKQYNHIDIATRFLKTYNFKVEPQKSDAFMCNLLAEKDGKKYVTLVLTNQNMGTEKAAASFKEAMHFFKADSLIAISIDKTIPSAILNAVKKEQGIIVDNEDLMKIAGILDNKVALEENGTFEEMFKNSVLANIEKSKIKSVENNEEDEDDIFLLDSLTKLRENLNKK